MKLGLQRAKIKNLKTLVLLCRSRVENDKIDLGPDELLILKLRLYSALFTVVAAR